MRSSNAQKLSWVVVFLAAAAAWSLWQAPSEGGASAVSVPSVLATAPGAVLAVAVSDQYVAWRTCNSVEVRDFQGRTFPLVRVPPTGASNCHELFSPGSLGLIEHDVLALFGGRITWSEFYTGNSTDYAAFGAAQVTSG